MLPVPRVGGQPQRQRSKAALASYRKRQRQAQRALALARARTTAETTDPELAQWYALGGSARVISPAASLPSPPHAQDPFEGLRESFPAHPELVPPEPPVAPPEDDGALFEEAFSPRSVPRARESRGTNTHEVTLRLENENQELKTKLDQEKTRSQDLLKQLRESQALYEKAEQDRLATGQEISNLKKDLDTQTKRVNDLVAQTANSSRTIAKLHREVARERDDVSAKLAVLEARNTLLKKNQTRAEKRFLQATQDASELINQCDQADEEKTRTMAHNSLLQTRLKKLEHRQILLDFIMERKLCRLEKELSSQSDELSEYKSRVTGLNAELSWYEENRQRLEAEWDKRLLMEIKWRDDLQAAIEYNDSSLADRSRSGLAAPMPS